MRPCILSAALCKKVFPCLSIGLLKSMLLLHNKFNTKLRSFLAKASRRSTRKEIRHKNPSQSQTKKSACVFELVFTEKVNI